MENTISPTEQSGMSPKKVKTLRIIAFAIVIVCQFYSLSFFWIQRNVEISNVGMGLISTFFRILRYITFLCLAWLAPNKPVRIATVLLFSVFFVWFIPYPYGMLAAAFLNVYLWSVILLNTKLPLWAYILPIFCVADAVSSIMSPIYWALDPQMDLNMMQYNISIGNGLWLIIRPVLFVIANYKLFFSEAFSGNYERDFQGTYSPLNKYFIGGLIAVGVTCGLLTLVFVYGNDIMVLF